MEVYIPRKHARRLADTIEAAVSQHHVRKGRGASNLHTNMCGYDVGPLMIVVRVGGCCCLP